jgi:hypothetical protein
VRWRSAKRVWRDEWQAGWGCACGGCGGVAAAQLLGRSGRTRSVSRFACLCRRRCVGSSGGGGGGGGDSSGASGESPASPQRCFAMGFVDFFLKASRNCRVASQHEFRCRVLCDVSNGLPSSPPVKKVHANSPSLRPGHMHLLKRARFLDSRTPGPICFVPGFPAQF